MRIKIIFTTLLILINIQSVFGSEQQKATGPKYSEYIKTISALHPEQGRIFFYKPNYLGCALKPNLLLKGEKIGTTISRGFFYIDLDPGIYTIETSTREGSELPVLIKVGRIVYIKFNPEFGGYIFPELMYSEAGEVEIQDTKLLESR